MAEDTIREVGIDHEGRLYVSPSTMSFEQIYRAAMEVSWDSSNRRLLGPVPREWSYVDWFNQIVHAAADEYGAHLRLNSDTIWTGVPAKAKQEILSSAA